MTLLTSRRHILAGLASVTSVVAASTPVLARIPDGPIKLINSGAAGSVPDLLARLVGEALSAKLRLPIVIDNRPGAGGVAAMQALVGSEPSGSTLGLVTISQCVFNSYTLPSLPYDPMTDLAYISKVAGGSMVVAAHPGVKADTFAELVEQAKALPGKLLVGTPAFGTPPHLIALKIMKETGITLTFVPFKSGPDAIQAAMRGDIQILIDGPTIIAPQVHMGSLKALAITSPERNPELPDVPTVKEVGFASAEAETWFGIVAPIRTPQAVIDELSQAIAGLYATSALSKKLVQIGFSPITTSPEQFAESVRAEHAQWAPVLRAAQAKAN